MFKKKIKNVGKKVTNALELPKEIVLNAPLISLTGNTEMSVENYKGIIEYTDDCIRLNTYLGILKIEGKRMILKQITSELINIKGVIIKVEFIA